MNFLRFILILIVVLLVPYAAASQTDDKICISQQAANACRDNALLIPALNEKIAALEAQVKARDTTIQELKEANAKNVADLATAMHKTEMALATKTGELIGCKEQNVEQRAILSIIVPMVRQKTNGIKIF